MLAFGRRAVPKLVDVLKSVETTGTEKVHALALLIGEASTQERKVEAIRGGGVEAAVALLMSPDANVRTNAGVLLARLVLVQQGRAALGSCGGVHPLTFDCADPEVAVRNAACAALASLAFFRDGCEVLVASPGAIESLVHTLDRHPGAVNVLVNATAYYAEGSRQTLAAGGVRHLVTILCGPGHSALVLEQACLTLRHLVVHDAGVKATWCCMLIPNHHTLPSHFPHKSGSGSRLEIPSLPASPLYPCCCCRQGAGHHRWRRVCPGGPLGQRQ
jgi:hypothetical protein